MAETSYEIPETGQTVKLMYGNVNISFGGPVYENDTIVIYYDVGEFDLNESSFAESMLFIKLPEDSSVELHMKVAEGTAGVYRKYLSTQVPDEERFDFQKQIHDDLRAFVEQSSFTLNSRDFDEWFEKRLTSEEG